MRCFICNASLATITWDNDHGDWAPCATCQREIDDLLDSFKDVPFVEENDLYHSETEIFGDVDLSEDDEENEVD